MAERTYLKNFILVCGERDEEKFKSKFTIVKHKENDGASCACYSAHYDKSGIGILKEFYPRNIPAPVRDENGQLRYDLSDKDDYAKYKESLDRHLEPYGMLLELKRKNEALAAFIPPFEIYYGCDEQCNIIGTAYIWSPEPQRETFEDLCNEIHKHPDIDPEKKLLYVLSAIEALIKCVYELHNAGMLHRDIKPSNFGLLKTNKEEILPQAVTVFDVDSICSVYNVHDGHRGTNGFVEPELDSSDANNLTDIYSIGASLFYAIIMTDETSQSDFKYISSYYNNLKQLVDDSALIQCSDINSHQYLREILTTILQRSLCSRADRYPDCESMLKDVQRAIYYMLPSEIAKKRVSGNDKALRSAISDLFSGSNNRNTTFAIMHHLYEYPLYSCVDTEASKINVLCIGCGKYGAAFLDTALQIAQIPGKQLNVTVVSDRSDDKTLYLSERPELDKFFDIDKCSESDEESYGKIEFKNERFSFGEMDKNLLSKYFEKNDAPDYVFVAIGDDQGNMMIADYVLQTAKDHNKKCVINAAREAKITKRQNIKHRKTPESKIIAVYLNEDIKTLPMYHELERMAFNVHLIWKKNLNIDYNKIKSEFRTPYNYNSCISFVLAIKYKLYGIGIDIESDSVENIAKIYLDYIKENPKSKHKLIWLEHRRWVTEKLCLGYTGITDIDSCVTGKTADKRNKKHICILKSRSDNPLSKKKWDHKKWDSPTQKELDTLDDLDRMSVELHMVYMKHARQISKNNIFYGEIVSAIKNRIEIESRAISAFQELITCMKDIWNDGNEQWRRYESLKDAFSDTVKYSERISESDKNSIQQLLASLNEQFNPVVKSRQYRSYKDDDIKLIEGIPFILTYSDTYYMAIPYRVAVPYKEGTNDIEFSNIAAATVINPSRLIYFIHCDSIQKIDAIRDSLVYLNNYMNKKNLRAGIEFIIGYSSNINIGRYENIEKELSEITSGRVKKVKMVESSFWEFADWLDEYLISRIKDKQNFLIEYNDTSLGGKVADSMRKQFSVYSFDSRKMKFENIHNCEKLDYIRFKPYITVTDMAAFRKSSSSTSNKPEFFADYNEFWSKYKDATSAWKYLCKQLKNYADENDLLAVFSVKTAKRSNSKLRYIVPSICHKTIERIFEKLKKEGIIDEESSIECYTTESYEVIINGAGGHVQEFNKLFSRIYTLIYSDMIYFDVNDKTHEVSVYYDDLSVKEADCGTMQTKAYDLLKYFADKCYLIDLIINENDKKISFTYATHQIKQLLTMEGKILEIYTYHKALESGKFNDIRSGFELNWENDFAKNEFDCILTRGFSSLFVECKATKDDIKSDYYTKISSLVNYFGINAIRVLIADTQESEEGSQRLENRKGQGNLLNVVTITNRADIDNIGEILAEIINPKNTNK